MINSFFMSLEYMSKRNVTLLAVSEPAITA